MRPETPVDLAALQALLTSVVAPWVTELNLHVLAATPGEVTLALPIAPRHVHGGGVLCGQTMMAAADTAMILAIARVLRLGKRLVFGEIEVLDPAGQLAAHATTSYALL